MPPEYGPCGPKASSSADAWLLGGLIAHFYVHNYLDPTWVDDASKLPNGVSELLFQRGVFKDNFVSAHISTALDGLLRYRPNDRWDFRDVREWTTETPRHSADETDFEPLVHQTQKCKLFGKAAQLSQPVKVFGLCVSGQSDITKSMIDQTLGSLGLGQQVGLTMLFIQRSNQRYRTCEPDGFLQCMTSKFTGTLHKPPTVVDSPCSDTRILKDDWIYLKMSSGKSPSSLVSLTDKVEHEARTSGVEIFLQIDQFEFPQHCVGMTVGGSGSNCLNLRKNFKINLAFIGRPSRAGGYDPIDVNADTVIELGDLGLVCRVPDRDTGMSQSIISDEILQPLLDEKSFHQLRGDKAPHGNPLATLLVDLAPRLSMTASLALLLLLLPLLLYTKK